MNTSFKHFVYFTKEFHLIDKKEFSPLAELIEKLVTNDRLKAAAMAAAAESAAAVAAAAESSLAAEESVA